MDLQAKKDKKNFFMHNLDVLILVVVTAIGLVFSIFHVFDSIDYRYYDAMLGGADEIRSDSNIVLIDIDDESLNEFGSWPWTRDILADILIRMREFGAYNAVFDIEYLSPSNMALNHEIGDITENVFTEGEEAISNSITSFADSVANRTVPLNRVRDASKNLVSDTVDPILYDMFSQISDGLYRDNDLYFAQAIQFFGNASLTINMRDISIKTSEEDKKYAETRFLFGNVVDNDRRIDMENSNTAVTDNQKRDFTPALHKIISHASGAGFTNVVVDSDGSRRRVELLNFQNEKYVGQLAFAPLVRMLDVQFLDRTRHALTLYGAKIPGSGDRRNIKIPLDKNGRMIINWLHQTYANSFKHAPVFNFNYVNMEEKQILSDLNALLNADVSALEDWVAEIFDSEIRGYVRDVLHEYQAAEAIRASMLEKCKGFDIEGNAIGGGLTDEDYDNYYAVRNAFFDDVEALTAELIDAFGAAIPEIAQLQTSITVYREDFAAMKEVLQDAFCIIGNSATGSTDMGTMPFQSRYPNMGTHANVINTILHEDFITEINEMWVILAVFVFAFIVIVLSRRGSHAVRNIFGFLYVVIPIAAIVAMFVLWQFYTPIMVSLFIVVMTYLGQVALNFASTNADKNTLRRGFDAYVAPEVVSQIVKNPGLLGLGGMNKRMTALFSDVQKFSAFTEQINKAEGESHGAVRLVEILNGYLGVLSDAIMDCRGTIDKYVGDEIVAFFGAPIDNPNNAFDSCVAGIRMKQAEDRYNEEHLEDLPLHPVTGEPFLLKSRVGCNTGDMVVGNMGTEKKLNYTIMGNNVNLASRLEGTNKEYDSWIIASESTWLEANSGENVGKIVARQLDCVKVINVEKPVQIYSIVGMRNELTKEEIEAADIFNQGMEWYLKGRETPTAPKDLNDFKRAIEYFERAYKCLEPRRQAIKDFISPEKKMAMRCQNYLKNGLPLGKDGKPLPWDGVFTMATK